jgi:imidazolonepropionase-like amidohydrolase
MRTTKIVLGFVAVALWLLFACSGGDASLVDPTVIVNGALIDGTGADPIQDAAVIVDQGVIIATGPEAELELPDDATVIDAGGGTILPGIIDVRASDLLNRLDVKDGQINKIDLELSLVRAIQAGVTTVRATGWDWREKPDVAALRAALESHGNTVPTVVLVGPFLTRTGGVSHRIYPDQTIGVATVEEARQATEDLIAQGLDQIGVLLALPPSGRVITGDEPPPDMSLEMQRAIVEAVHARDVRVITQAVFPDDAAVAVAAGADEIPSWPAIDAPLPDDLIQALVDRSVPILTGYSVGFKPHQGDARRFIDAGGTIVFGTFAPNSNALSDYYHEMDLMSSLGEMTPMEIIVSATANAAEVVGLGDEIGTLEAGKKADIIVVDGNPLDDLTVFRDGVTVVMKGGDIVPVEP